MQAAVPWYRILCASGIPPCAGPFNSKIIEPGSVREIALGREPVFLKETKKFFAPMTVYDNGRCSQRSDIGRQKTDDRR